LAEKYQDTRRHSQTTHLGGLLAASAVALGRPNQLTSFSSLVVIFAWKPFKTFGGWAENHKSV
jgi:hypothetical protein